MSDLPDLKKKIAAAFEPESDVRRLPGRLSVSERKTLHDNSLHRRALTLGHRVLLLSVLTVVCFCCVLAMVFFERSIGLAIVAAGTGLGLLLLCGLALPGLRMEKRGRQRLAARALAESAEDRQWQVSEGNHLLSSVHEAMGDIALICDPAGRILHANAVFHRMTGVAVPEGLSLADFGLQFQPTSEAYRYRVEIATDAGLKIFDWHDVLVRDVASGVFLRHSIARDVTADDRVARETSEARLRAEAASQAKSRLLATVSHEIRTPLSGILGMSHLISQTRLTGEQKNYLEGMRQSGHALVQLVDDLLDFASIEAGRFQLRPSQEAIRDSLEQVVEMLAHRAHQKGIEIGCTVSSDVPVLLDFDAARLRQVLFNVVGNAVKFTHQGGVTVRCSLDGDRILIRVEDTGLGMSPADQARIFEAFEQAGDDAQRVGGTGLGLPISKRIMEAFGGSIKVDSVPGRGTTFEIRFPAVGCDLVAAGRARSDTLAGSHVLVMAPAGPAAEALAATITTLGGVCICVIARDEARRIVERAIAGGTPLTDIIVDHRHAADFRRLIATVPAIENLALRRIYLVNPEERSGRPINRVDGYQAWLIRPLRERSLIEVLKGRMRGMEVRDAINDNRPMLREVPAEPVQRPRSARPAGILLAEDDPVTALMVRAVLERAGYPVDLVESFDALRDSLLPHNGMPDLIVTDLNMPGGDGLSMLKETAAQALETGKTRPPTIVLTSDSRKETHDSLMAAGALAVFTKPVDPRHLMKTVDRLLQS